ncbi:MAG TPA: hypothetical protein VEX68_09575 [Bryobacteraceae bacterium]|nr:hypothetical protein [Bryobacteraceae bacterium]
MPGRTTQVTQIETPSRTATLPPNAAAVRGHLQSIVESPAFKGSRRGQAFLRYIVDKALHGEVEALKERVLGVELFGRPASYDTSEDAIVRVTASDLRRRLHQFYAETATDDTVRIELPSGSYIPEFRTIERPALPIEVPHPPPELPSAEPPVESRRSLARRASIFAGVILSVVGAAMIWGDRLSGSSYSPAKYQPWATLLQPGHNTRIVFCDPDISLVQHLLGFRMTLSDYANRRYWPTGSKLTPETQKMLAALRGTKVAFVDSTIALHISSLAATAGHGVKTHPARGLQLLDFKTDDNFILLGSPRSNPWLALFSDKLDFQFDYDVATNQEIVVNRRPLRGEQSRYLPTAQGGGTGQAYAVLAFASNPGQQGNVMLLAGTSAEATEAAGNLATNVELLARTLKAHDIDASRGPQHFEILLRVSTMAGTPNTFEVIACHRIDR